MVDVRASGPDDLIPMFETMGLQFAFDLPHEPAERDVWRQRIIDVGGIERGRIAHDGDRIVGSLGCFAFDMTVPDGSVSCAGTTWVTVAPSHRRQGVLRSMMRSHLDEAVEHGDAIAALWASDSAIYGRFGYGMAVDAVELDLDRTTAEFLPGLPTPDRIDMVTADAAASILPPLYERIRLEVPATFSRSEAWWQHRRLRDTPDRREGKTAFRFAVSYDTDDEPSGYAQFRVESKFDGAHSDDRLEIIEMFGTSPSSWLALWTLVMGFDLVTHIEASKRPVDDPIFQFLVGLRRAKRTLTDTMWVRVLDVGAAMTARSYATTDAVTIDVKDSMGYAAGRHRIAWDGTVATHASTSDPSDLRVDVSTLGVALMGRPAFVDGVRAGTVGGSLESAFRADRMFRHARAPFCPEVF